MDFSERTVGSRRIYEGKIISLRRDTVMLENGSEAQREVVEHHGGVGVLAIDDENRVLMVRQYRYGISRLSLEIPAGKLEPGEDPAECGMRELREETGCTATYFAAFGSIDPTPAYCSEVIYLFLAKGLSQASQSLDPDEFLTVSRVPFEKALEMCLSGEITDAKTVAAVLKFTVLKRDVMNGRM